MIMFVDFDIATWLLLILTVILSMFGQLGDLVESGFKRHFGVKDSGRILLVTVVFSIDLIALCLCYHY